MKLRHIAAIFCFLAAFGLSVFLVGLTIPKSCSASIPSGKKQSVTVNSETELQARIRKFLEADYQTGIELANDKARLSQSNHQLKAEELATFNLVEKMQQVKCTGLPEDFCNAWDSHLTTWKYKAFLLDRPHKSGPMDYQITNEQINNSYKKMLAVARKHGVDFKY